MQALQALDPDNLGKANVTYHASMDAAIKAVENGEQDVALMVQFANPENPRFVAISCPPALRTRADAGHEEPDIP